MDYSTVEYENMIATSLQVLISYRRLCINHSAKEIHGTAKFIEKNFFQASRHCNDSLYGAHIVDQIFVIYRFTFTGNKRKLLKTTIMFTER